MTNDVALLVEQAELIASAILRKTAPVSDDLTTREAHKAYGRKWVEDAFKKGKVNRYHIGNKTLYSRTELDALRVIERRQAEIIYKRIHKTI